MEKERRSAKRVKVMLEELGRLKDEGVLTPEQVSEIERRVPPPPEIGRNWGTIVRAAFSTLAVLLLGFALFLLLGHNWKLLAPWTKTAIVLGSFLAVSFFALFARMKEWRIGSETAFFGGAILYGVGIFQIGQIFNIESYDPQGVWLWALGVWAAAFLMNYDILHVLAALLLAVWVVMTLNYGEVGPGPFRDLCPSIPNAAWTLPLLAGVGFYWSGLRRRAAAGGAYALVLFFWWAFLPEFCEVAIHVYWQVTLGGFYVVWSGFLPRNSIIRKMIFVLGFVWLTIFLFPMTFYENGFWFDIGARETPTALLGFSLVFFLLYSTLLWRGRRRHSGASPSSDQTPRRFRRFRLDCALSPGVIGYLFLGILTFQLFLTTLSRALGVTERLFEIPVVFTVFANLALLGLIFWLMTRRGNYRGAAFWTGFACFILWAFFRYLDLFGDFGGMLGAAVFFTILAVAVFIGGSVWSRKIRHDSARDPTDARDGESEDDAAADEAVGKAVSSISEKSARILLAAVILFEFGVLTSMILSRTLPFIDAQVITVETEPVDPRDLFRGDYVILDYSFTNLRAMAAAGTVKMDGFDPSSTSVPKGGTVYVAMTQDAQTGIWKESALSLERPKEGVFLKGFNRRGWGLSFGISTFYVPEGGGKEIEDAMRDRFVRSVQNGESDEPAAPPRKKVVVDLLVSPAGNARVKDVRIVTEPGRESLQP